MAAQAQTAPKDADAGSASTAPVYCPDPSAHKTKDNALQNQASAAALYSASAKDTPRSPLGVDGRLSSASAATSLGHAQTQNLPGFPVVGIDTRTSANTAAHLASTNTKSPEGWKPEQSAAAEKAALLANDLKMKPLWQPEASAAGSKAALLAHKDNAKVSLWTSQASSYGNSAATIAMGKKAVDPPIANTNVHDGNKALIAATGAVSSSGRQRAQSTPAQPELYPDASNWARNALSAATIASSPSMRASHANPTSTASPRVTSPAMEAARIQHAKTSKEMYTERPPVAIEVEEKKRQDALRASAISMAKKMYDVQQQHIENATGIPQRSHAQTSAAAAHSQQPGASEADLKAQAMQYIGVQEAAQRLAAERLAKIEPDSSSKYRNYYGYDKPTRSKLSIRLGRPRAASNPETVDSDDDELTPRRIRNQMSQLNKSIAEIDAKKREQDRKQLLAAAERKVHAQMLGLDKKIFDETGKMSPAMIDEWDAKARAKAAANSEARMEHHGKVHLGNGKYMDQADIEAVALARVQPTLNDIAEKTEKRRAEEEEQRLEMEEKKREAQLEKERHAEMKAEEKRVREEEKRAQKAREAAAKQEKEARKEKEAEEKRMAKEEKRKSREAPKPAAVDTESIPVGGNDAARMAEEAPHGSPTSPRSESKGLKSLLNKLKRRSKPPGFLGGAALRNSEPGQDSTPASPTGERGRGSSRRASDASSASGRDGGRTPERRATDVSEMSEVSRDPPQRTATEPSGDGYSDVSELEEARDGFNEELAPPPIFISTEAAAAKVGSPTRDSKFHEVGI